MAVSRTEQLVEAFLACTLPRQEWTHHAHLRVGLWHLLHLGPDEALAQLRERIQRYNLSIGGANTATSGYHETITRFYVWLIARFVASADRSLPLDTLADELIRCHGDRDLPLRYYTQDRLQSVAARLCWLEPDLLPLEKPPTLRTEPT